MKRKNNQSLSNGESNVDDAFNTEAMDFVEAFDIQALHGDASQSDRTRSEGGETWQKTSHNAQEFVFDADGLDLLDWLASDVTPGEKAQLNSYLAADDGQSTTHNSSLTTSPASTGLGVNLSALMAGVLDNINIPQKTIDSLFATPEPSVPQLIQRAHFNLNLGFYAKALVDYQRAYQAQHGPWTQLSYADLIDALRDLSQQAQQKQQYPRAQALLEQAYLMMIETYGHSRYCAQLLAELGQVHKLNDAPTKALDYFTASLRMHITQLQSRHTTDPRHRNNELNNPDEVSYRQALRQLNRLLTQWSGAIDKNTALHDAHSLLLNPPSFPASANSTALAAVGTAIAFLDHNTLPSIAALYAYLTVTI